MAYIKVIQPDKATGDLKNIYDDLIKKRGKLAEVHKIQSLNPQSIINHMDLYLTIMFGKSPLKRYQREMLAVVVSSTNQCPYCVKHHAEALNHFWKDNEKVDLLATDLNHVKLSALDDSLCQYAIELTKNPSNINEKEHIHSILKLCDDDRLLLDTALIVSYFNFVNRMVLGLGVNLEEDGGGNYNYE